MTEETSGLRTLAQKIAAGFLEFLRTPRIERQRAIDEKIFFLRNNEPELTKGIERTLQRTAETDAGIFVDARRLPLFRAANNIGAYIPSTNGKIETYAQAAGIILGYEEISNAFPIRSKFMDKTLLYEATKFMGGEDD